MEDEMITVIIPTNRFECLKVIFEKCINLYKGTLFKFAVHDSSEDNDIKNLCLQYCKTKKCNLQYYQYNPSLSVDIKAINAIKTINSDYFWLFGDGNLVNFNEMEQLLISNDFMRYDVLNIDTLDRRGYLGQDKEKCANYIYAYEKPVEYARKYFSRLTYWGSAIIRTKYYNCIFSENIIDKYVDNQIPWWIACSIFEAIAYWNEKNIRSILGVVYTDCISYNPAKKDHWWTQDEKYYFYVFTKFNQGINLLPKIYSSERKTIICFFRNDALVSNSYLLYLRSIGTLNRIFVKKYKSEIVVVDGFYYKMLFFCCIPQTIAVIGNRLKYIIKKFFS